MNSAWWWFACLLPSIANAQTDTASIPHAPWQQRLTVVGGAGYDSNVLGNDLVWGLIQGGALSREVRLRNSDALGANNRFGMLAEGTATMAWGGNVFGWKGWIPRISLSHRELLGVRFNRDAFDLSFFGNAQFADRTASIGPGAFEQLRFQHLAFGVEHRATGTYVELGVVNGMRLSTGQVHKADLYTAPDGRFVELDLDGRYERSDTAANSLSSGLGLALNLQWRHALRLLGGAQMLTCTATGLGFVVWGPNTLSVQQDSIIHFEGLAVDHVLDLDKLILDEHRLQDSLGLGYKPGSLTQLLPAHVAAKLEFGHVLEHRSYQARYAYGCSIEQLFLTGYLPRASVERNLALGERVLASIGVGAGGFGGLRMLLGVEAALGKHLHLGVGMPNVIGLLSEKAPGKAIAGRVEVYW